MQLVCDGLATKNDVLVETIDQYKEIFIKARREIATLKDVRFAPFCALLADQPLTFCSSLPGCWSIHARRPRRSTCR
jgi:hypothetical protein